MCFVLPFIQDSCQHKTNAPSQRKKIPFDCDQLMAILVSPQTKELALSTTKFQHERGKIGPFHLQNFL